MVTLPANLPSVPKAKLPASYEAAKAALAECSRIDECQDWADKMAALASYAKQSEDDELQKMAVRIKARAIRRCGELLEEIEARSKANLKQNRSTGAGTSETRASAAAKAGMSKRQKDTAIRVARVPRTEFEAQLARIYSFNEDEVWAMAVDAAKRATADAQKVIRARCRELGIPVEFAPSVHFDWYGRGQNAVKERRTELRKVAQSKIEAITLAAKTRIERMSMEAQTEVIASGLESAAARAFLNEMPPIEQLMPPVDPVEVKALVDGTRKRAAAD